MRLYPTIIRYDTAYAVLFKCSRKRVGDYPNLAGWLRDMYQLKVEESTMQVVAAWQPWPSASMYAVPAFCGPGSFALDVLIASSALRRHVQHSAHTAQGSLPATLLGLQHAELCCRLHCSEDVAALVSHEQ